ncbi:hypothetical protein [Sphingomonas sp.]|uniref:hypothetical protein n=1 Tax=Sphingomonas sp. TaxID=28214 RepID=UPI0035C85001
MRDERITPLTARQYALVLLGLLMLWPAAINRAPFLFRDTTAYVHGADAAIMRATGATTAWSNEAVRATAAPASAAEPAGSVEEAADAPVLLGRSIFYGVFAWLGALTGTLWTVATMQALLVGAVVLGLVRHVVDPGSPRFARAVVIATLALATTPLAWFTAMVMPDVLTGLALVAAAVLLVGWRRERAGARALWFGLASFAALAHSSHVLILLALGITGLAVERARVGAGVLILAALTGVAGEVAFARAVEMLTGSAPIRPPFVTARLAEDGPTRAYLDRHCATVEFHLCRYATRLPLNSDLFLWNAEPARGVFMAVPAAERRALAAEQPRFVWAVMCDQPLAVARVAMSAVGRQFAAWRLSEFNHDLYPDDARAIAERLPPNERAAFVASRAFAGTMPIHVAQAAALLWAIAGVAVAFWSWARDRRSALSTTAAVLVAGWVLDVVICGALSTPHDRYQARVLWVLALLPVMLAGRRLARRAPAA